MDKKQKLKLLYAKLNELEKRSLPTNDMDSLANDLIEEEIATLTARIKGNPTLRTLQKFKTDLNKFTAQFDLKPILASIKELQRSEDNLINDFEKRIKDLPRNADLTNSIDRLSVEFSKRVDAITDDTSWKQGLEDIKNQFNTLEEREKKLRKDVENDIDKVRIELLNKIVQIPTHGGGNANRNISIGGNNSVLSKYTDLNIKAGSNVTITYAKNETTKQVDVTFASSGGGGGGSVTGIIREINNVSTSQTMGNTVGTDYVYIATAGVQLTYPAAVSMLSQYTIKNISTSSVLLTPDGSDTIDNTSNLILRTQFTAVDTISNGVSNWNIT